MTNHQETKPTGDPADSTVRVNARDVLRIGVPGTQTVVLVTCAVLLAGILIVLLMIGFNGVRIRLDGAIDLSQMTEAVTLQLAVDEPIALRMEEPVQVIAAGPDGDPIPATLVFTPVGASGPVLPIRWNPWTGELEWGSMPTRESDASP